MAEPVVTPVVVPVTTPVVAPVVDPVTPVVDPAVAPSTDFSWETWNQSLDEDLRTEKSLESFKHAKSKDELTALLAKSFVNTKKMVGANVIAIPTDISTEGEWQEFHKAGGRPETVADYNLKAPEGFPEEALEKVFPKARLEAWQERFFKGGVSKKAADLFIAEFANDMITDLQTMTQAKEAEATELVTGLATDWGAAFEQKKHLGNIAMNEAATSMVGGQPVVNEEFKARLVQKAGNDPDIIRAFANLGEKFAEGKPPGFGTIPTPSDLQDQIDKLMEDPLYTKGTQAQRMKIADKIMAIRKLQKPEPATTT